jgi:hypothetical protein
MTKPTDPYSRVYWKVRSDERFVGIYSDDHHFATWVRLLIAAEAAWPEPADIPSTARRASLRALSDAGIIVLLDAGLFRVHGLDAERMRRQERAATAASARWMLTGPVSNADGMQTHPVSNADGMPRARPEQSIAEQSRAQPSNGDAPADALDDYYQLTLRYPTGRTKDWLEELAAEFGHPETGRALSAEYVKSKDAKTILSRTEARLRSDAHHAEMERAKPKPRPIRSAEEQAAYEERKRAIRAELMSAEGLT